MTDRLNKIYNLLPTCNTFADIGCDHGYITKAMLYGKKCERAIIADVSEKCLDKARQLLNDFIACGKVEAVVSNGFEKVNECDLALIAGMGGEEIVSILKNAKNLPKNLVLQPMKNCDKVRVFVVEKGYKIVKDLVFKSANKFYDLIVLTKGKDSLTDEEIEFGRDNLLNPTTDFKQMIASKIEKINGYLQGENLSQTAKEEMQESIKKLEKYV